MPSEESRLLGEDQSTKVSKRTTYTAGAMLSAFGVLAVMTSGSGEVRPIPSSFQDFRDHLPTWSFLLLVLLHSVREIVSGRDWEMGAGLKLYTFALPYVIALTASSGNGWGAVTVQVGVVLGVVATVLDQLRSGYAAGWHRWVNVAASALLVIGTVAAVSQKSNSFDDSLPFIAWATTGCAWVYFLVTASAADAQKVSVDGFNDALWLLVLYTAAQTGDRGNRDIDATLMKVACLVGAVYSVLTVLDLGSKKIQNLLVAVTYAAIFVPLSFNTLRYTDLSLDAILKNIAAWVFAVILGVRAVLCLFCVFREGAALDDRTDGFVWLFVLCLVLQLRGLLSVGQSTSFSNAAQNLAQAGPAIGVVVLVLSLLGKWEDILVKLRHAAELITILGILLA